jgi:hypothetical protein
MSHIPVGGFTGWEGPAGFTTFEVVQSFAGLVIDADGDLTCGPREYHFGVGHAARLPGGGRLSVTPSNHDTYTASGYYLAGYDASGNWLWGQRFSNVHAALSAGRSELRRASGMSKVNRVPYVGEGADGCRRSAQIDREEADILDVLDPRLEQLHASAQLWEAQAERITLQDGARPERRRPEQRGAGPRAHGPGRPPPR